MFAGARGNDTRGVEVEATEGKSEHERRGGFTLLQVCFSCQFKLTGGSITEADISPQISRAIVDYSCTLVSQIAAEFLRPLAEIMAGLGVKVCLQTPHTQKHTAARRETRADTCLRRHNMEIRLFY